MLQEFIEAVNKTIQNVLKDVHTAMPGKIISFNPGSGLATVLPELKYKRPDGKTLNYPQISGVPVVFPQANSQQASVAFPVSEGDGCLLIIAEQAIDYWLYGRETSTDLMFDLTNAICIPGLFSYSNAVVAEACGDKAIIIDTNGTRISVKENDVKIKSTKITLDGNVAVNGNVSVSGRLNATRDVVANGVSLVGHSH